MRTPVSLQHPIAKVQRPAGLLLSIAVLSALIYWFGLTQPYYLFELYQQPLLDLRRLTQGYPEKLWPLIVEFVVLFALYLAAWQVVRRTHNRSAWLIVSGGVIVFSAILLFMYPYDAADTFDNIMHGRILSVYGANPFRDVAVQFSSDPIFPYVAWRRTISAYGPGWEIVAGLSARLAGNDLLTNVFTFKLVLAGFLAGCAGFIAAILRRLAPERMLPGVTLFLWNPVVLYETIGLAALLPIGHAVRFALLFSFAVLSEPLIFGPQLLWPTRPPAESRLIEVYLGPLVLALSWLYAIYALFDTWRCRRSRLASE